MKFTDIAKGLFSFNFWGLFSQNTEGSNIIKNEVDSAGNTAITAGTAVHNSAKTKQSRTFPLVEMRTMPNVTFGIKELEEAIDWARDYFTLDRQLLYNLYRQAMLDLHLAGVMRVHENKVIRSQFIITDENGNEDTSATDFFKKQWFRQFRKLVINTGLWGHSLIEPIIGTDENGDLAVQRLVLMPREYVSPEMGTILPNQNVLPTRQTGIPFRDGELANYVIELGEPNDLGMLQILTKEIIRKSYSDKDWSAHSEQWMASVVLKTRETRLAELQKKAKMLANMGNNGWMITDSGDELQHLEMDNEHAMYEARMDRADAAINLLIIGSASLGQEQAFVGSAQVSERIADDFKFVELQNIEYCANDILMPFLVKNGFPGLKGKKLKYPELEGDMGGNTPDAPATGEKKKLSMNLSKFYECGCGENHIHIETLADKKSLWQDLLLRLANLVHSEQLVENMLEQDLVNELVDAMYKSFWKDYTDGYGRKSADWSIKDVELLKKVHDNVYTFSGAKTLEEMNRLKDMVYENGKLVPWTEYRKRVLEIDGTYNITYLETERNAVQIGGTMGSKWVNIQETKHLYPYLKYVTEGDARVRPEHQRLNGIVLPVDDAFWLKFYPPNGWKCRCDARQLSIDEAKAQGISNNESAMKRGEDNVKDLYWQQNAGATGLLFPPEHQYFNNLSDADRKTLQDTAAEKRQKLGIV